jgi:hypothetical protein
LTGTGEDTNPRIARVSRRIVEKFGRAVLLERFHVGALVVELRAFVLWIRVVAVLPTQTVEVDRRESWRRAGRCLWWCRWMIAAAVEHVQPQIALLGSSIVEEIGRAFSARTDVVGTEIEIAAALGQGIRVDTVRFADAVHRRFRGAGDVDGFGGGDRLGRSLRARADERIRRNIARLRVHVVDEALRAVQFTRLTTVAAVERV